MAKLYLMNENIESTTDDNDLINDSTVGVGNWAIVDDAVWIDAQHNSNNTLVDGVFTAGKTLSDYKVELHDIYLENIDANLIIDSLELENTNEYVSMITAQTATQLTSVTMHLADGSLHTYLIAELMDVSNHMHEYRDAVVVNKSSLSDDLDTAGDPSTVDLTVGWPSTTISTA